MIVITLRDIIGLSLIGIMVLPFILVLLWIGIKRIFTAIRLKNQGFSRVDRNCRDILHCSAYDTGFCTRKNGNMCQFHPKYKKPQK